MLASKRTRTAHVGAPSHLTTTILLVALLLLGALGATAQVVISQVYGAGGNSGATLQNDYVELFNRGSVTVNLNGLTVQYTSATGTGNFGANAGLLVALSGTLAPGQYYLVQVAGGTNGSPLPAADATGTISMAAGSGKVALVNSTTGLGCNGSSTPCTTAQLGLILDLVGYGAANFFEGSGAAPTLSATTAAFRANSGCTDSNNNSADFAAAAPAPRNSASALNVCGAASPLQISGTLPNGTVGQPYAASLSATGGTPPYTSFSLSFLSGGLTLTPGANNETATISGTPLGVGQATVTLTDSASNSTQRTFLVGDAPSCAVTHTISQIQGTGSRSPLEGGSSTTQGVVTARKGNGFFIQSSTSDVDSNPVTSEGLFVFTSSAPPTAAAVGNLVCVSGNVIEFAPSAAPFNPPLTEITQATVSLLATGQPLPTPVSLTSADLTPAGGIEQLERYEGMRVAVANLTVVAPSGGNTAESSATATSNGFFFGVLPLVDRPFREPGVREPIPLPLPGAPRFDGNPELLRVDSRGGGNAALDVSVGQTVANLVGALDYGFGYYTLVQENGATPLVIGNAQVTAAPVPTPDQFTVATFNVERFFDTVNDPTIGEPVLTAAAFAARLNKLSLQIRDLLHSPDILGMVEVENLSTLQAIANQLNTDSGNALNYIPYLIEGNDVGGIDVGFLVNANRVQVDAIRQEGKDATFANPTSGALETLNDRPPLVLEALVRQSPDALALPVIVVVNHLRSLNGIEDANPVNALRVRTKRARQAEFLAQLLQDLQVANPQAHIASVGDYNAFQFNDGYADVMGTVIGNPASPTATAVSSPDLVNPDFSNLMELLPASQRYTFVFDGSAQILDHIVVNNNLLARHQGTAVARANADFALALRNDTSR
nr:lamin tail domain-containing protein [Bryobacterales bacterium]